MQQPSQILGLTLQPGQKALDGAPAQGFQHKDVELLGRDHRGAMKMVREAGAPLLQRKAEGAEFI